MQDEFGLAGLVVPGAAVEGEDFHVDSRKRIYGTAIGARCAPYIGTGWKAWATYDLEFAIR